MASKARELANLGNAYSDGALSNRNLIINGAANIDQRNGGGAVTLTGNEVYVIDRWPVYETQSSVLSGQQNQGGVTPPAGFSNYLGYTSLAASTVSAGDLHILFHNIEGNTFSRAAWGTANALPVTLSFWVRCSLTGTFGGSFVNHDQNRSYPYTYTVNSANTWEFKTITVEGDTTGTWKTDNTRGLNINWSLGTGSNFEGAAGSWVASNKFSATEGTVNLIETNGATFQITGVQLEVGDTATPFEHRSFGQELTLCQRFFCKTYNYEVKPGTASTTGNLFNSLDATQSYPYTSVFSYPVTMRATPTITVYNPNTGVAGQIAGDSGTYNAVVNSAGSGRCAIGVTNTSIGQSTYMRAQATADAEL